MHARFELRWVLVLMLAVPGVTAGCMGQIGDAGGGTSSGSGGRSGPAADGTGGTVAPGSGGSSSGGPTTDGTGGSNDTGTGGSASPGTGGSTTTATGGSTGTGGSAPAGTGGSGGTSPGSGAGGSAGAGPSDAGVAPDPFSAAPTCTSGTTWKGGNEGSASMNPGKACISCHKSSGGEAPTFSVAGTLYPTAHEPDLCNGFTGSGSAQIVITGADGKTLTLMPNSAGNFYSSTSVKLPYQAKVVYKGQERAMVETQSTGDCNSCHTQNGSNGAPGRILLP